MATVSLPGECREDRGSVAVGVARGHDAQAGFAVLDDEDLIGICGLVADRPPLRERRRACTPPGSSTRAVANMPGLSAVSRLSKRASRMKTREFGIDRWIDGADAALKIAARVSRDAGDDRHRRDAPARRAARVSAVAASALPMRTIVAILLVSATYSPAATGRAVM